MTALGTSVCSQSRRNARDELQEGLGHAATETIQENSEIDSAAHPRVRDIGDGVEIDTSVGNHVDPQNRGQIAVGRSY